MFTRQYITDLIQAREYDTIAIFNYQGTHQIDYAHGTKTDMVQCWEMFTDSCASGTYMVHLYENEKQSGGGSKADATRRRKIPYRHTDESQPQNSNVNDPMSSPYVAQIIELHTQLSEMRMQQQMQEFRNENQAQGVEMITTLVKALGLTNVQKKSVGIAQPPDTSAEQPAQDEFVQTFEEWQQVDPEWFNKLKGLVKVAKNDPDTYKMAGDFISSKDEN